MKKRLVKFLLTVLFAGLFIYYYVDNPESIDAILSLGAIFILGAIIYQIVALLINDLVTKLLVDSASKKGKLSFIDGYYSAFISSFGNYFLPLTGGALLRAVFLKRQHNFSYKKFISISYGSYIVSFLVNFGVALLVLLYLYWSEGIFIPSLTFLVSIIFIVSLSLTTQSLRLDSLVLKAISRLKIDKRAARIIDNIVSGWRDILRSPGLLPKLVLLTLANLFLRSAFYYVIFLALSASVSLFQAIIYSVLISLSLYVTITPGSVGVREAILVFYSESLNISQADMLSVSLVDRASLIIILVILFLLFEFVFKKSIIELFNKRTNIAETKG